MTDVERSILTWLIVWAVGFVVVVVERLRSNGSLGTGLVVAYFVSFGMLHWPAAACQLLPWSRYTDHHTLETGLQQSAFGVIAFCIGCVIRAIVFSKGFSGSKLAVQPQGGDAPSELDAPKFSRLPLACIAIGLGTYLLLSQFKLRLPTVTAVASMATHLMLAGLGLGSWIAWIRGKRKTILCWFALACLLPFMTMILDGFLGFGTVMLLIVSSFVITFYQPKRVVMIWAIVLSYLLLSAYVIYMDSRDKIRESVWGGEALPDRMVRVGNVFKNFELFDPTDEKHLWQIDRRLNQNMLVGAAVQYIDQHGSFANGETIRDSVYALVPRAIWADKPVRAGGGFMVTEYTGIVFAEGTSVGMGQVFEFYINFGSPGVLVGFLIFGFVLSLLDTIAAGYLRAGNWKGFITVFMTAIGMIQPHGSLVEITASCAAAFVASRGFIWIIDRYILNKSPAGLVQETSAR